MAGIYTKRWRVTDAGMFTNRLVLHFPETVKAADLAPEKFSVYTERRSPATGQVLMEKGFRETKAHPARGYVPVLAAWPMGKNGNPVTASQRVALDLEYGFFDRTTSPFSMVGHGQVLVDQYFRVTQVAPIGGLAGLTFDRCVGLDAPQLAGWKNGVSSYKPLPLGYGEWTPPDVSTPRPLVIWLHGAGEGGTDPTISYVGNLVTNLSEPAIQRQLGGAYLLAPQSPTMWMDNGSGQYTRTGKSMYCQALKALIDEFVATRNVDKRRIYLGGCSNGGFMTVRMAIDYPGFFAALYPCCEALYDETITDEQIAELAKTPIWFVHARNDTTVPPAETAVPTYKRLMAARAKNCHFFFPENVHLEHTEARSDGGAMDFMGHFSWTYIHHDLVDRDFDGSPVLVRGRKAGLFRWLAAQKL